MNLPIDKLTTATVTTIITSRLITKTVNQIGRLFTSDKLGIVKTTKVDNSSNLSAIGSSSAHKSDNCPDSNISLEIESNQID